MPGFTVANLIRKNALSRGDSGATALVFKDIRLTYEELDERTDRLAQGLKLAGFRRGERVAVFAYNRAEYVETFFALAKLGGVIVPVNYLYRAAEVTHAVEDSGASWLIADPEHADVAREAQANHPALRLVVLDDAVEKESEIAFDSLRSDEPFEAPNISPDETFVLQYTSGTTGRPKAATHTHTTVMNNALSQMVDMDLGPEDTYLNLPALCWASGFHSLTLATWWRGGSVVLYPSGGLDPADVCETIERESATAVILVPAILRSVLNSSAIERCDLSSLRMVVTGAEPCPVPLLEQLQETLPDVDLLQAYGQSEFPSVMTILDSAHARTKVGSAGKTTSLAELRVVDTDGQPLPPGQIGEIMCRSLATMVGYWENPEETAGAFSDGWLITGDQGLVDEDGFLFISGRSKDMIISGGLNVYPAEVEREIGQHPLVEEVAVVGIPDERFGEVGCAHVVPRTGAEISAAELEAYCKERLAGFKVPRAWVIRDEPLPRTTSNKLAKFQLREPVTASADTSQ